MSNSIRTIVVGVASMDDQDPRTPGDADPVLGPAVQLAKALGAQLHAVHAFEIPDELASLAPGDPEPHLRAGAGCTYVRELEDRLERQLASIPGGDAAHCRAVAGSAADVLCEVAGEVKAELLVVGASRRGRAWSGILGSTASQVIAASAIQVLVVHRPFGRLSGRVLLTSDLSVSGWNALRQGIETARRVNGGASELRCLHVVDLDPLIAPPVANDVLEAIASARLDRSLEEVGLGPAVVERRVRMGDAAREINREALEWGADLVVVGTHGRAGAGPPRAGHVAMAVARGASCNVLFVRASAMGAAAAARASRWSDAPPAPGAVLAAS
ncbi:MAG TPA: universal stress protein [Longimicrobium sp.]|nr:universal stress protein [Longimicrobium sp.]